MTEPDYNGKDMIFSFEAPYYGAGSIDYNDLLLRHQEDRYDHVKVYQYDEEGMQVFAMFLGRKALDELATLGIPEAFLDEPTGMTVEAYNTDLLAKLDYDLNVDGG